MSPHHDKFLVEAARYSPEALASYLNLTLDSFKEVYYLSPPALMNDRSNS